MEETIIPVIPRSASDEGSPASRCPHLRHSESARPTPVAPTLSRGAEGPQRSAVACGERSRTKESRVGRQPNPQINNSVSEGFSR